MIEYDVVIPSYNQDFTSLMEDIKKYQPDARVTILDNGKRDYVHQYENITCYSMSENLGFVKATNVGIAMSTAPYVVLQNDDTRVFNNIYNRMKQRFDADSKVGIVGAVSSPSFSWVCVNNRNEVYPQYNNLYQTIQLSHEEHAKIADDLWNNYQGRDMETGHMVPFFCTMIKREVIEKVGYLSEAYGVGLADDDDYCRRVVRAGYKITLALDCYVWHKHRATFKTLYTPEQLKEIQAKNLKLFKEGE